MSEYIINIAYAPDMLEYLDNAGWKFTEEEKRYFDYGMLAPWDYTKSLENVFAYERVYNSDAVKNVMMPFLMNLYHHRFMTAAYVGHPAAAGYTSVEYDSLPAGINHFDFEFNETPPTTPDEIIYKPTIGAGAYWRSFGTNNILDDLTIGGVVPDGQCIIYNLMKEIAIKISEILNYYKNDEGDINKEIYWVNPLSPINTALTPLPEFISIVERINGGLMGDTIGDFDEMYFWCKRQLSWMRKIIIKTNVDNVRISKINVKHESTFVDKYLTAFNTTYDIHGLFNRSGGAFYYNPDNPSQTWIQPAYSYYDVPGASNYYRTGFNQDGTKKFWQRVPEIFCVRGEGITIWPSTGMERISVGSGPIYGTSGSYAYFQSGIGESHIFSSFPSMADYHNFVLLEYLYQGYKYARAIKIFNFGRFVTSADGNFNFQYYNEPTYGGQFSYYSNVFRISPWTRFIESFPCRRIIGGVQTTETNDTVYYDSDDNSFNTFLTSEYGCYHRTLFSSPFPVRDISGKDNIVSENWPANQPLEQYTKEYTFTITHTTTENYDPEEHQINANFYINPDINNVEIKINGETITQNLLQNPDRFSSPDENGFRYMYDVGKVVSIYIRNLHINNDLEYSNSSTQEISAATTIQCFNATYWQGTASNGWGENHYVYDVLNIYPKQIPANYVTTKTASFPYTAPNHFKFAYKNSIIAEREDEE